MKPEWRTENVRLMCQGMREAQDYSLMPILADALQDAGCDIRQSQVDLTERRMSTVTPAMFA